MKKRNSVIFLIVSLFVFSCSEKSPTEAEETIFDVQGESGFVGTVTGTNAFIAVLVADDEAIVYVCNGDDEDISEWFTGAIVDPTNFSLTNSDGAQISGKFDGSSFTGIVTFTNARTHSFTATPNSGSETKVGVFQVHGDMAIQDEVEAGWIVNAAGEERGSLRVKGKKKKAICFECISDGSSNTLLIGEKSYPVLRWFLRRSGSFSVLSTTG